MQKKLYYYQITEKKFIDGQEQAAIKINEVLSYILQLDEADRQHDLNDNKFCLIESCQRNGIQEIDKIVLKSAFHKYRAPLLDRNTGLERENPKTITEGDRQRTHIAIKHFQEASESILLLEGGANCLTIKQVESYFNWALTQYYRSNEDIADFRFSFAVISDNNFLENLNSLEKVVEAQVILDKEILGSDSLNLSQRIVPVKSNVKLVFNAERSFDIKGVVIDVYNKLSGGSSSIKRIIVKGKNETHNNVILNTESYNRIEFVNVQVNNETGEINSIRIMGEMVNILLQFI